MKVKTLQVIMALDKQGLLDTYTDWATSDDRTQEEKDFIHRSFVWERDNEILNHAMQTIGLDTNQINDLFVLAATL